MSTENSEVKQPLTAPTVSGGAKLCCPVGILGIGHYVPDRILTNQDLPAELQTSDDWITSRTGIKARRVAEQNQATSDLAAAAAFAALADAKVEPTEIDLIIVATMTPDCPMPNTATIVQEKLGAFNAGALDINVACSGFAYALTAASQFVASGLNRRVLVIGADVMTRVVDWKDRSTCVLFGDGAGAVLLGPISDPNLGILAVHLGADGRGGKHLRVPAGGSRMPHHSAEAKPQDYFLQMDGKEVYRFAVQVIGQAAEQSLRKAGLTAADVKLFIPHQANSRIIEAAAKRLGLRQEQVFVNVQNYGNTSCGSIPIALSEAVQQKRFTMGDVVVMVGFGGGLSWGAVTLRWNREER
jgi:3-oxoacyl-[acyl-carrier-protein] synthase III